MNYKDQIAELIHEDLGEKSDLTKDDISLLIEIPPEKKMGDFAFPCFKLAKIFRKSPQIIAVEISKVLEKKSFLKDIVPAGGYINFYLNEAGLANDIISKVIKEKENYCKKDPLGKTVIVEYSSPNIAKPFHIGHIRTTVIGSCLYKLMNYMGYKAVSINHLGDYGTQFGKLIVAYKLWGNKEEIIKDPINVLLKLYVKFHEEAETKPELEDQARGWFTKLEHGDEEAREIWKFFRAESLKEFDKVYKKLNITFDSYAGESFYQDKMGAVIDDLKAKNLLEKSEGSMIVNLEKYDMPSALIQKRDGSTLYLTRDLATAIYRKNTYDFYKNIYVVASQQTLHFRQMKQILKLLGYDWYDECIHVQFGMVSLEDGQTLSTRKGQVVFLKDVLDKAIEKSKSIMEEKNPNLENMDTLAEEIGVGAIIFQELSCSRIKDYSFSFERTLSFDGETGPYVQYTHARACSVLRKAKDFAYDDAKLKSIPENEDAMNIIKTLASYPDVLERAAERYEPHHITRYVLDLSGCYNKFYHDNPILTEPDDIKKDRLLLTKVTVYAIRSALSLLGIAAPERM